MVLSTVRWLLVLLINLSVHSSALAPGYGCWLYYSFKACKFGCSRFGEVLVVPDSVIL